MTDAPTLVAVSRVRPERADEFERWLAEVAMPAVRAEGIADDRWRLLRSTEAPVFVFLFTGGAPEDWDLSRLLPIHYGTERAEQELRTFSEMLETEQDFWPVVPVGG